MPAHMHTSATFSAKNNTIRICYKNLFGQTNKRNNSDFTGADKH